MPNNHSGHEDIQLSGILLMSNQLHGREDIGSYHNSNIEISH